MTGQEIARTALRTSIELRRKLKAPLTDPICIYDFAEALGVEVRFVGGSSFGGMYAKGLSAVFVPSERPNGRRAFTCAHELAHWKFDHGQRIEHLDFHKNDRDIPEERLANQFAAFLLMPTRALKEAFAERCLEPDQASEQEIYKIACQFGVGYETLLHHLNLSERTLSPKRARLLLDKTPKAIKNEMLGRPSNSHLICADFHWKKVPIDLEVGDHVIVPHGTEITGQSIDLVGECPSGLILRGLRPGLSQVQCGSTWAHMVRVSRKGYVGRGAFRHLEDEDNDEND